MLYLLNGIVTPARRKRIFSLLFHTPGHFSLLSSFFYQSILDLHSLYWQKSNFAPGSYVLPLKNRVANLEVHTTFLFWWFINTSAFLAKAEKGLLLLYLSRKKFCCCPFTDLDFFYNSSLSKIFALQFYISCSCHRNLLTNCQCRCWSTLDRSPHLYVWVLYSLQHWLRAEAFYRIQFLVDEFDSGPDASPP